MGAKRRGQTFNLISQLSLRERFGLGLGAMLMPFFFLAGSTFLFFEQAVSSFEQAENKTLEARFPLAELKSHFGKARPTINALLNEPGQLERLNQLNELNVMIQQEIDGILKDQASSPEKQGLLVGIGESWNNVYAATIQYPQNLPQGQLNPGEAAQTRAALINQIQQELEEATRGIDRIEILLAHIQTADNLALARKLKRQERFLIGFITLAAISIALLSAIFLSRSVLRSMQVLIDGLENLSEGELDNRIEWANHDEFGRLANAINHMAEKLAQSQQALIEIATLDGLTGVFNRREFNRLLTIEIERSRRNSYPVSMVMVDIDHFKSINDTYGHQSGDDALKWVSAILTGEIRPGDFVARYGGEEFLILFPNTNQRYPKYAC